MDLRKSGDRPVANGNGGAGLPSAIIAVGVILALCACWLVFFLTGHRDPAGPAAAQTTPPAHVAQAQTAMPTGPYVRIEWYEPFDPKKSDEIFGHVQDQYGCWWWDELGNHNWTHSYRAYKDGKPDCPADAMPDPLVEYMPQDKANDLRDDITVVSKTVVDAGDPKLVAWYRERRDEAEQEAR